jgi:serine phosphatase RsbU (regulator of sigma subunit)/CHASE2 domain-containing sensor protein
VKPPPAAPPAAVDRRRITLVGVALLGVLTAIVGFGPRAAARLQAAWFDAYQRAMPRQAESMPIVVVQIDERSLARYGQWPWPRTLLAELVRDIERQNPAAIGIDILMPEADRLSPEHLLRSARRDDPILASRLDALPSNDIVLASAIAAGPVVLGLAGTPDATGTEPPAPPFVVVDRARATNAPEGVAAKIPRFGGALSNIAQLDRAAAGHGVLSAGSSEDVIRRAPLVVRIGDRLAPSLVTEMLRVALGVPDLRLYARGPDVESIDIGTLTLPTEVDGQVRLHYAKRDGRRDVSAVDVLEGSIDPARFEHKVVLVSVTGLALVDYVLTPLGERMPGSEVHAQFLENVYDQAWLTRPRWAPALEATVFAVLGLLLVHVTPRWKPDHATLLAAGCVALLPIAGVAMFAWRRIVFDAAVPTVGLLLLFGALLVLTLNEATRQRKALERTMQQQREHAAYIAGELEAAKRIQVGFLPRPDALADDLRAEVAARMTPAREVGGDLYDFFRRDRDRLFFLVGDVAGKGLSASLFMAVGKALSKSVTMRSPAATVSEIMQAANVEISRDNPEMFFITAVAGILDLESGVLDYCNAGHEYPVVLSPTHGESTRLTDGGGPPLCTVDDFPYGSGRRQLTPGEVICVVTDGVPDAQDPRGTRYGMPRLLSLLTRLARSGVTARALVDAVAADVEAFAAGAEPADDLTVLALRWNGGRASMRDAGSQ